MFCYLALIWNSADASQDASASSLARELRARSDGWSEILGLSGLTVFCSDQTASIGAVSISGGNGVILGTLFERASTEACPEKARTRTLEGAAATRVLTTAGRSLVSEYWGRYVAFLRDPVAAKIRVLRDPIGVLPCNLLTWKNVHVIFSSIADCQRLMLPRPSVNWEYVRTRVCLGPFRSYQTGLAGVTEIQPGECVEFDAEQTTRCFYWSPDLSGHKHRLEDPREAATQLRSTVKACVHAWASCHTNILHSLSGGLDSSIVMGCLRDAPTHPTVRALTHYYPKAAHTDCRYYARLSAAHAGSELTEIERQPESMQLETLRELVHSVKPLPHLAHLEYAQPQRQVAREIKATAIFNGDAGDYVFCSSATDLAAVDYARQHGLNGTLFKIAQKIAPLAQISIWSVLAEVVGKGFLKRHLDCTEGIIAPRRLVHRNVREQELLAGRYQHPWFVSSEHVPPGKLLQTRLTLIGEQIFYPPMSRRNDPEEIDPLRSQPIVELCLQIPTYVHLDTGTDRGLARRAFAGDVPEQILRRLWKGRPGRLMNHVMKRHFHVIRDLLLDGFLVKEGLLDRHLVSNAVSAPLTRASPPILEVFDHLIVESWLRRWIA